jgi:hypothetical protein
MEWKICDCVTDSVCPVCNVVAGDRQTCNLLKSGTNFESVLPKFGNICRIGLCYVRIEIWIFLGKFILYAEVFIIVANLAHDFFRDPRLALIPSNFFVVLSVIYVTVLLLCVLLRIVLVVFLSISPRRCCIIYFILWFILFILVSALSLPKTFSSLGVLDGPHVFLKTRVLNSQSMSANMCQYTYFQFGMD